MRPGFDVEKYIEAQTKGLVCRLNRFSKLYLEIGGRICQDTHTSRVLPGYPVDTKARVLKSLGDFDFIYCISARDIVNKKRRKNKEGQLLSDYALQDLERIVGIGIRRPKVAITLFKNQGSAIEFKELLEQKSFEVYTFNKIDSYPHAPDRVLSKEGFGRYKLIETDSDLVVVSAPGGDSGKMGFCISQLYLNHLQSTPCGFAKFETLPVWNMPLAHPLNISYEFATVNTRDDNLVDKLFSESSGGVAVTYNRDVENYAVLRSLLSTIFGKVIYSSPTEMGVNMIKEGITDDAVVREASLAEIKRRFDFYKGQASLSQQNQDNFRRARELVAKYGLVL
jgi:uncharacterized protein (UPF0371 family)